MRPLEIFIPIILAFYLLWPLVTGRRRPQAVGILPAFALVVTASHANIEGMRWQMYPLYALSVITFFASLPAFMKARSQANSHARPRGLALAGTLAALLLLAVFTALPALLPVPAVAAPRGPYSVGTVTYVLTDPSRRELYSGRDEPRKFMVQVWYPANPAPGARPAPWMPNAEIIAPAIAVYFNLPDFFLDHLVYAKSNAYPNAPLDPSGGPYPVLIFSHGWNGFRAQSTFLMQDLASHGYIVVGMEHPYGSLLTVFPDGQTAANNPRALPDGAPEEEYETAARLLVDQWAGDMAYALDTLTQLNTNDPDGRFTGALDLTRVGALGHSTGGGASIQFCGVDARCRAVFPLDPFMRPVSAQVLDGGLTQPFATFFSQSWAEDVTSRNNALFNRFYPHLQQPLAVMSITGTRHYDFSDLPALSPLAPQLGLKGPINGARVQTLIQNYVLAFFDLQFKGIPTPLFNGPQPDYPEVNFLK